MNVCFVLAVGYPPLVIRKLLFELTIESIYRLAEFASDFPHFNHLYLSLEKTLCAYINSNIGPFYKLKMSE